MNRPTFQDFADIKDGALCAEMAKQTWADISKAERLLQPSPSLWLTGGESPRVTPEDPPSPGYGEASGFQRTVDWHVANREWLKGIKL